MIPRNVKARDQASPEPQQHQQQHLEVTPSSQAHRVQSEHDSEFGFGTDSPSFQQHPAESSATTANKSNADDASVDSALDFSAATPSPIQVYNVAALLQTTDRATYALCGDFIGPLDVMTGPSKASVVQYAESKALQLEQYASAYGNDPRIQSFALLWRLLALACRHNGRLVSQSVSVNQPENIVCFLFFCLERL
jgi:hypothetical protein